MGLVQHVLGQITDEFAMKVADHSVPAVMAALPVQPLQNEQVKGASAGQKLTPSKYILHSPRKYDQEATKFPTFDQGFMLAQSPEVR